MSRYDVPVQLSPTWYSDQNGTRRAFLWLTDFGSARFSESAWEIVKPLIKSGNMSEMQRVDQGICGWLQRLWNNGSNNEGIVVRRSQIMRWVRSGS